MYINIDMNKDLHFILILIIFRKNWMFARFRWIQLTFVQVTKQNGTKGRRKWIVVKPMRTCVYQTKDSHNWWNFVTIVVQYWFLKVKTNHARTIIRTFKMFQKAVSSLRHSKYNDYTSKTCTTTACSSELTKII